MFDSCKRGGSSSAPIGSSAPPTRNMNETREDACSQSNSSNFTSYSSKGDSFYTVKTTKSFGTDKISSCSLELALPLDETSLVLMFNTSIETTFLPAGLKVARLTPIFKMDRKAEKSNYRRRPFISRLFEKQITDQL